MLKTNHIIILFKIYVEDKSYHVIVCVDDASNFCYDFVNGVDWKKKYHKYYNENNCDKEKMTEDDWIYFLYKVNIDA